MNKITIEGTGGSGQTVWGFLTVVFLTVVGVGVVGVVGLILLHVAAG